MIIIILLSIPFWLVPLFRNPDDHINSGTLPLFLTIAWYFGVSWFAGRVCVILHLPPVIGYLISGFSLQYVCDPIWFNTRPTVQLLAFLIVLCRAGLEISPQDLSPTTLLYGTIPVLSEAFAISIFSMYYLNLQFIESISLGLVMSPIGDGLVLPKLQEYKPLNLGQLPRVMFTSAPLEVITVLFLFGICQGFAQPGDEPLYSLILFGFFGKFFGTILISFFLAFLFSQLARNRSNFSINGRSLFTGTDKEELLFIITAVLIIYSLCDSSPTIINNGYSWNSPFFQSDMAVIVMTIFYAQFRSIAISQIENTLAELWMFGALFLFTTLGSNIQLSSITVGFKFLPVLLVGLTFRLAAVFSITYCIEKIQSGTTTLKQIVLQSIFVWVASFPRATIQGALCHIPTILSLFSDRVNLIILHGGIFVLALNAPFGSILLDLVGIPLLKWINELEILQQSSNIHEDFSSGLIQDDTSVTTDTPLEQEEWRHRDRQAAQLRKTIAAIVSNDIESQFISNNFNSINESELSNPNKIVSPKKKSANAFGAFMASPILKRTNTLALGVPPPNFNREKSNYPSTNAFGIGIAPSSARSTPPNLNRLTSLNITSPTIAKVNHSRFPDAINHGVEVSNSSDHHPTIIHLARNHSVIPYV